jgi:hypothetical protein
MQGIQIGRKEVKMPQFADDIVLYLKDPKSSTEKLLDLINTSTRIQNQYTKISCISIHK